MINGIVMVEQEVQVGELSYSPEARSISQAVSMQAVLLVEPGGPCGIVRAMEEVDQEAAFASKVER
jgi:hypothetical protein